MKKILAVFLMAAFLSAAGCSRDEEVREVETGLADNAFAVVNGEPITQSVYRAFYNGNLSEMGITQQELIDQFGDEEVANYENDVLEDLITQQVLLQYADEHGFNEIPEDVSAQIDESAASYLDNIKSELSSQISAEGASGVLVNSSAELEKRYAGYLKQYGLSEEVIAEQLKRQYIIEQVNQKIMEEFVMPEDAVQNYYDEALKEQKDYAEAYPEEAAQMYLQGEHEVELFVPESLEGNARYVKHILITPPAEYNEAIAAASAEGDEEAVVQLSEEAMEEARLLAEDVIEELNNGADFDELVTQYNQDPGVESNPDGYLIYEGAPYVENFLNEGLTLNSIGDYSTEPVETEYGYHIILYASDIKPGAIPLSEVEDEIYALAESAARSEFWINTVNNMVDNAQIEKIVITVSDLS